MLRPPRFSKNNHYRKHTAGAIFIFLLFNQNATRREMCIRDRDNIARTTLDNLKAFFADEPLPNEICYYCGKIETCNRLHKERCF